MCIRDRFGADIFNVLGHCRIVRCAIIAKNSFIYLFFAERLPRVQGQILACLLYTSGKPAVHGLPDRRYQGSR